MKIDAHIAHTTFTKYLCLLLVEMLLTPEVQVLLGEHDTSDNVADRHNISAITPHPRYNETTADFDFAVITLAAPVNFSAAVAPICLPGAEASLYTGETATITGWGHTLCTNRVLESKIF